MDKDNPQKSLEETKNLLNDLSKEIFDIHQNELTHLEEEFEDYKLLYPDK